jgi:Ca2+-binding RTX toxin-like protein
MGFCAVQRRLPHGNEERESDMARLKGTRFNDRIVGTRGRDTIDGGPGNDNLAGKNGNDTIKGGPGNDHITGGKGGDLLFGGSGRDVFKFAAGDSFFNLNTNLWSDVVVGFQNGLDKFDLPVPLPGFVTVTDFFAPLQGGAGAEVAYEDGAGFVVGRFFVPGYSSLLASVDDFI